MKVKIYNWWNNLSLNTQIEYCQNANYDHENLLDNQIVHIYNNLSRYSIDLNHMI